MANYEQAVGNQQFELTDSQVQEGAASEAFLAEVRTQGADFQWQKLGGPADSRIDTLLGNMELVTSDDIFNHEIEKEMAGRAVGYLKENLVMIDQDGDGFLTPDELAAYRSDHPEDRKILDWILDHKRFSKIESSSNDEWGTENDGITMDDIIAYKEHVHTGWENA